MLTAVTDSISVILGWIGSFITSLTSTTGALYALLPLFAIGIAVSAILLGRLYNLSERKQNACSSNFWVTDSAVLDRFIY